MLSGSERLRKKSLDSRARARLQFVSSLHLCSQAGCSSTVQVTLLAIMAAPRGTLRVPCFCSTCKRHPDGFRLQTKQQIVRHMKKTREITAAASTSQPSSTLALRREIGVPSICPGLQKSTILQYLPPRVSFDSEVAVSRRASANSCTSSSGGHQMPSRAPSRVPSRAPSRRSSHTSSQEPSRPFRQPPPPGETFTPSSPDPDPDPWVDIEEGEDTPMLGIPAMQEASCVRMAYLKAVLGNVFGHLSWERASMDLDTSLNMLASAGALPDHPPPVRTLQSARKCLGIDPDAYIIQYALCPLCWVHHSPEELKALESPACATRDCEGQIYTVKNNSRIPTLIHPQVSVIGSL